MKVTRTERGWAGHFICALECRFRRNTLLEAGETRIIVSTVGNYVYDNKVQEIGLDRYHETMAFHAEWEDPYWEVDVHREVPFESNWSLGDIKDDNIVNEMHETVVNEIMRTMK